MQPQIDRSLILEAMQRRGMGQQPQPAVSQMTAPGASLATGGGNTPLDPPVPQPTQRNVMPRGISPEGQVVTKARSGLSLDDEGKGIAKSLINKLMQVL